MLESTCGRVEPSRPAYDACARRDRPVLARRARQAPAEGTVARSASSRPWCGSGRRARVAEPGRTRLSAVRTDPYLVRGPDGRPAIGGQDEAAVRAPPAGLPQPDDARARAVRDAARRRLARAGARLVAAAAGADRRRRVDGAGGTYGSAFPGWCGSTWSRQPGPG